MRPEIGVVGLGYVGLVWATVLATRGFNVIGVDIDRDKVEAICKGHPPVHEYMLDELLKKAFETGRFEVTTSYEALRDAEVVFITVGTPSSHNGCADLSALRNAINSLARVWRGTRDYKLLVIRSTVPPGTTRKMAETLARSAGLELGRQLGVVYNPEFLREGRAVLDVLNPSRIVIGELDTQSGDTLLEVYTRLHQGILPPVIRTTIENAELAKYASNIFLAAKISLVNTLALLADKTPHTDIDVIANIIGLDPRIGKDYLRAGIGFGGSCLPKDLDALICYSKSRGLPEPAVSMLEGIRKVNAYMTRYVVHLAEELLEGLEGKRITVLGLAFKPGTNDIRNSKSIELIKLLVSKGAVVRAHDPLVKNVPNLKGNVIFTESLEDALDGSNAVIIATPWPEYSRIKPETYATLLAHPKLILDPWRIYKDFQDEFKKAGLKLRFLGVRL